ncbi:TetR/AcrR family transcriptional regulator [Nonomuraea endophytica]|uniref:AcrR family transcriptional regulator n=1 Tax=Nonomuraea endophytica TaxID=714136 RepID=A0A7W8A5Z9_9ACTN|nr:TetR/AcrR family transcriptional regulator [Nonomuraea endophytica]MBB5080227.1 AcrR family transcriptional regulator [Nonomuraea endophytica]
MVTDHRKQPRRRGEALHAAIFEATLDELAEVGYAKLTMERVAERARTGKASLYRRWPSRLELVMAAVYSVLPDPADVADTGSLRGDLLALLRHTSAALDGAPGEAMRGLLSEALGDRGQAATLRENSQGAGRRMMHEVVRRAVERGEVEAGAVTPRRLDVGQAMIRQHFLFNGPPIPDTLIVEVVDEIIVPLLGCPAP